MSEATTREAVTGPGQAVPPIAKNQAVSFLASFETIQSALVGRATPRRPNRNRPLDVMDPELRRELAAWDAASDEDFRAMENDVPE